ncbi:MAG: SpoIIIAC/SpoIIIAD family protein [Clostridiaceae bacterium]|nr:SpoIIIAC/SpoIIIAD family protein [Clostridiaceae bacterium]
MIVIIGEGSKVMSTIVAIAAGVVFMGFAVSKGVYIMNRIKVIAAASGIESGLILPVVKVLGIALCARITAELCRDMGNRWAACNIEIFAVITSVICMLPLLEEVLKLVGSI